MTHYDVPTPDGATVWIDRCALAASCGIWYDAGELAGLHPRFADESVRAALASAPPAASDPRRALPCPRCEDAVALACVRFAGVVLDRCDRCRGVWVDRDEFAALMNALRLHVVGEGPTIGAAYRTAAVGAAMHRTDAPWSRCVACKTAVPFADAMFTERGLMCVPCGLAHQRRDA